MYKMIIQSYPRVIQKDLSMDASHAKYRFVYENSENSTLEVTQEIFFPIILQILA
jgi:hypothetical protein